MNHSVRGFAASTRTALVCTAAVLTAVVPALARAQEFEEAQPATDASEDSFQGNEIVVTATKREQTLQDVPVAVTVTTAQVLERAFIRDIKDLATVVPSLRVGERQNANNTNFFIRGFGNGANNAGIEPSVGVFIDGVYRSRSAAQIADLPDVERIEVLRGPQSTLFGKNASAGVISIVTQKPKFDFGGNIEASYGNYDAIIVKGVVTGPVSDSLALSVSGGYNKRDGFQRNLGTGNRTGERNRWFVRGQALFEPSDSLSVRIIGDYGKIDEICCAVVNVKTAAATGILTGPLGGRVNTPDQRYDGIVYTNFDSTNRIKNYGVSGQVDYELGPAKLTSITAYRRSVTNTNFDSDFTSADLLRGSNVGFIGLKTFTQELRLTASFVDKFDLLIGGFYFNEKVNQSTHLEWGTQARPFADALVRSLTGNAQSIPGLEGLFGALSGNPALYTNRFFAAGQGIDEAYRMKDKNFSLFSQLDFHVSDRLTLTGGIAYTNDKKRYSTNVVSSDVFSNLNLPALRAAATNAGIAQTVGGLLGVPGGLANAQQIGAFAAAQPAAFAQIQIGAANATLPLLGLRPLQYFPPFLNLPNSVESGRTSDDKFTYTARLAFDVSDTVNAYVSYATGYKASSINLSRDSRPLASDAAAINGAGLAVVNQTYGTRLAQPENSRVIEGGLKGNWGLVTANVAVFQQEIKGFQSNIFTGTGFVLANAGKQSVFGIEFEGTAKPAKGLTLGMSMTYLDPKYDSFTNSAFGDATGITPADIPPISATFSAEYDHEMGSGDHVIVRGSYHYESKVQVIEGLPGFIQRNPITQEVLPGGYLPGLAAARPFTREVDEVDASLTYAMQNGLELAVWGRNLLNDRYISTVFDSPAQSGSVSAYINSPRTYGVSARFRW
jgi:outer membrane receptor protein involved in Fe transport